MLDRPNALHSLGLAHEGGLLKGAYVTLVRGKPQLQEIFEIQLATEEAGEGKIKPLYMRKEGVALRELLDTCIVVTGLDAQDVLTRTLHLELTKDRDIEEVVTFQAEPLLPYPADEAAIDWVKHHQDKEGTDISILAARHECLEEHLKQWHTLAVEPESISCIPAALASFAKVFLPSPDPIYVVDIGLSSTTCIVTQEGKLLATQSSLKGVHHLFEAFTLDQPDASIELFYSLDFSHVEESLQPNLSKAIGRLRTEAAKTLYSIANQTQVNHLSQILVTGVGGVIRSLAGAICQGHNFTVEIPKESHSFALPPSQLQRYAIPIGYALSGLPKDGTPINFRQETFSYPDPWKRLRKPLATYFVLMFCLAFALFFFSQSSVGKKEDNLREEYANLLAIMQKPYSELEKSYAAKTGLPGGKSLNNLSQEELTSRIQYISQLVSAAPESFPLQPNLPTVSDLLAWLNKHPKIVGEEGAKWTTPRVNLENINYKIVKRPEKKKMRDKYQVKVDLEISAEVPRYAREFYDSLIVPNEMVDPKIEVKWSASRGNYRTTFFLKDKTVYP